MRVLKKKIAALNGKTVNSKEQKKPIQLFPGQGKKIINGSTPISNKIVFNIEAFVLSLANFDNRPFYMSFKI